MFCLIIQPMPVVHLNFVHHLVNIFWIMVATLPVVANVEYYFLPGEHVLLPSNMVLKNLHNFSIIGVVSNSSSPAVLIGCLHPYILKIYTSHNVNIRNV